MADGVVNLIAPNGSAVTVAADKEAARVAAGYRPVESDSGKKSTSAKSTSKRAASKK